MTPTAQKAKELADDLRKRANNEGDSLGYHGVTAKLEETVEWQTADTLEALLAENEQARAEGARPIRTNAILAVTELRRPVRLGDVVEAVRALPIQGDEA